MDQLIDHNGHLAIDCGWQTDWHKPEQFRIVYVGRMKAEDWSDLIGCNVQWSGNTGVVRRHDRVYHLQSDDEREWTREIQTRPVKKPRRGKGHDWEWRQGRWEKRYR